MVATYQHPGVYIEEIPSGSKPIEAVGTSTAVFVGYCEKGPVGEPVFVSGWSEYENVFGGIRELSVPEGVTEDFRALLASKKIGDPMGHAVYAFFENGGGKAWIVRLASSATKATASIESGDTPLLTVHASSEGSWGNGLVVRLQAKSTAEENAEYRLEVGRKVTRGAGSEAAAVFEVDEVYENLSLESGSGDQLAAVVNETSRQIAITLPSESPADIETLRGILNGVADGLTELTLADGDNGGWPAKTDYDDAFTRLQKYRDISIVLLPGAWWGDAGKAAIQSAIGHAETMANRMVIYDPEPGTELKNAHAVQSAGFSTSTYAALYYPWAWVANPFYDAERAPGKPRRVLVSPAAFAAGMWARIDGKRGVWKAPAGVEATLRGVAELQFVVENAEQDYLNPNGVNAFRRLPGFGSVIWGSRTGATRADPEWRYVPVRRTAIFIEESLYNGIQWAVFEPNDHRLWSALRINIESFMNGLFRVGAFQGEKASEAYFVRCGLGSTMTQGDIDAGRVIVEVGFAPLKPAEFVIVRIQQKVGQQ